MIAKSNNAERVLIMGDLCQQAVQRFASIEDCDRQHCTIEEREEHEQPY